MDVAKEEYEKTREELKEFLKSCDWKFACLLYENEYIIKLAKDISIKIKSGGKFFVWDGSVEVSCLNMEMAISLSTETLLFDTAFQMKQNTTAVKKLTEKTEKLYDLISNEIEFSPESQKAKELSVHFENVKNEIGRG